MSALAMSEVQRNIHYVLVYLKNIGDGTGWT